MNHKEIEQGPPFSCSVTSLRCSPARRWVSPTGQPPATLSVSLEVILISFQKLPSRAGSRTSTRSPALLLVEPQNIGGEKRIVWPPESPPFARKKQGHHFFCRFPITLRAIFFPIGRFFFSIFSIFPCFSNQSFVIPKVKTFAANAAR